MGVCVVYNCSFMNVFYKRTVISLSSIVRKFKGGKCSHNTSYPHVSLYRVFKQGLYKRTVINTPYKPYINQLLTAEKKFINEQL